MKNRFMKISVVLVVALLAGATVGITVARLQDSTAKLVNTFDLGSVETEIVEEGGGSSKIPKIYNAGESDCYVRVRVTISPAEAMNVVDYVEKNESEWDWRDDGFAYYTSVLKPGDTTEALFEGLALKEDMTAEKWAELGLDNFEVTVYQESVQTVVYLDGEAEENPAEIWKLYEAESAQNSEQN